MLLIAVILLVAALAAMVLTAVARTRLERAAVIDRPNARSLHAVPVPRGGGLAIVTVALLVQGGAIVAGQLELHAGIVWWLVGAGYALVGWCDDVRPRPVRVRLLAQLVLAAIFVVTVVPSPQGPWWLYPAACAVAVLAVMWTVNLFNFMDGADGFAATQTVAGMAVGGGVLYLAGAAGPALVALGVAAAALGFLRWNWFPAQIFMGDCGSYFLGFQFAALALYGAPAPAAILLWLILLLPFVVDATLTLGARMARGARWWQGHREHAFQALVLRGWTPPQLALALLLVNAVVCWPLALWSVLQPQRAMAAAAIGALVFAGLWLVIRRLPAKPVRSPEP